jgi:UDP-glucose 4-epimerase
MSRTVFITGIAGFLGRHIARHFAQIGWRVAGVDALAPENVQLGPVVRYTRLQLPSSDLGPLLRELAPDACIHCAGRASVPLSMEDPAADFHGNTVLTFELLDALRRCAPRCRFILLSSAAVYGNPASLPVAESQSLAPLSPYGFHKRQCELLCQEFTATYAIPSLAVRIFSAYGPGLRRQIVWEICERLLTTATLALRGTGRESRDFIHATDIARALAVLAEKAPAEGEIYNVSTGRETTIRELAGLASNALDLRVDAHFDGTIRPGDPLNWRGDITKLSALGFTPAIPLEQGLAQVAHWARAELAA